MATKTSKPKSNGVKTEADFEAIDLNQRLNSFLDGYSYYACIHQPNKRVSQAFKNAKPKWSIKLGLEGENLKKAKEMGLTIYEPTDDIPYKHVEIKRNPKDEDIVQLGMDAALEKVRPDVFDTKKVPVPEDILVGNGSKVRVKFARFWHGLAQNDDKKKGPGVGTALMKVQIRELVSYNPVEEEFDVEDDEEGSFSVSDTHTPVSEKSSVPDPQAPLDDDDDMNDDIDDIFEDEEDDE